MTPIDADRDPIVPNHTAAAETAIALTTSGAELQALVSPGGNSGFSGWLHAFRRCWILAIVVSMPTGACAAAIAWYTWKPDYTPVATLRIASQQPVVMSLTSDEREQASFDVYKKTQQQLIRDPFVLTAALRDPAVAKLPEITKQLDPVTWLQNQIFVSFPGDAEILDISMHGDEPVATTTLVNAVCDAYIDQVVQGARNERLTRLQSLEKIRNDADEKVRQKRSELKSLTESLGTGDSHAASHKQEIALESYAALRKEQISVQLELMRAGARQLVQKGQLENLQSQELPADRLESQIESQPEYVAGLQQMDKLRKDLHNAESVVVDGQGHLLESRRQAVTEAEQQLKQLKVRLQPAVEDQLRQQLLQQAKTQLVTADADVSTLQTEEEHLAKEVDKLGGEANQIGKSSVDLEMMKSELEGLEAIQKQLASEVENMKIEMAATARVELLSRAEVPRFVDSRSRVKTTAAAGVCAFFFPLFWICWQDIRRKRVNNPLDVSSSLGLPIIGTMPLLSLRAHRALVENSQTSIWNHDLIESIDSIRETLMKEAQIKRLKVILLTSAMEGEGKTTVATQLAKSLARSGHRTLLMDCDLRYPTTHRALGVSVSAGWIDVLNKSCDLNAVVSPTTDMHLYHLPLGPVRPESQVQLCQARKSMASMFSQLREQFEFIIVDSGPVLPVVDTLVVGQFADFALLSIMRDVSQSYQILEARSRLARVGINVLGTIVTCRGGLYGLGYRYGYALNSPAAATA